MNAHFAPITVAKKWSYALDMMQGIEKVSIVRKLGLSNKWHPYSKNSSVIYKLIK